MRGGRDRDSGTLYAKVWQGPTPWSLNLQLRSSGRVPTPSCCLRSCVLCKMKLQTPAGKSSFSAVCTQSDVHPMEKLHTPPLPFCPSRRQIWKRVGVFWASLMLGDPTPTPTPCSLHLWQNPVLLVFVHPLTFLPSGYNCTTRDTY